MPMLASRAEAVFDDEDWVYEIKWDGYRAISYLRKGVTEIRSRNLLPFDQKFPAVHAALEEWEVNAVVDGEIIAVNADNTANFQQLQNYAAKGRKVHLQYYLFDIVWYDGRDLSSLPLLERKTILEHIIPPGHPVIKYSDHISGEGKIFFKKALEQGLEGIMAKRKDSGYVTGYRTQNWLKIKNARRMEAIICGFTEPRRSRQLIGAVVLGRYEVDKLVYIGHSGSGLTEQGLKSLYEKLKKIVVKQCPFDEVPKTNMPVTWVKPLLVCEIKFSEWTEDGSLRHPIFAGLREDKTAAGEKNEVIIPVSRVAKKKQPAHAKNSNDKK